jgi:predicted secreted protein
VENEIKVNVGHDFTIKLEGKPTAGYIWDMLSANESLHLIKLMDTYWSEDKSLVGAPGIQNFVFKALSVGSLTITFRHRRPWEKDIYLEDRKFYVQIFD